MLMFKIFNQKKPGLKTFVFVFFLICIHSPLEAEEEPDPAL